MMTWIIGAKTGLDLCASLLAHDWRIAVLFGAFAITDAASLLVAVRP